MLVHQGQSFCKWRTNEVRIVAALHRREKIKRLPLEKILDLLLIKTKYIKEIAVSVLETEISYWCEDRSYCKLLSGFNRH